MLNSRPDLFPAASFAFGVVRQSWTAISSKSVKMPNGSFADQAQRADLESRADVVLQIYRRLLGLDVELTVSADAELIIWLFGLALYGDGRLSDNVQPP